MAEKKHHKIIIGITGSFGAGKGAVVEYLVKEKGFKHFSASSFITEEVVRRNMPINRDTMIFVGNELRALYGPAYIVESLHARAVTEGGNVVIESLRAVAEVQKIKKLGGFVLGVDAHPEIRYQRTTTRNSEKDRVSYEKWLLQEKQESNPDDPTKQNIFGALKESNLIIMNNGSIGDLHRAIDGVLLQIREG